MRRRSVGVGVVVGRSGDLYELLGVAKDASTQDIKKAFRSRARECHPDVAGSDPAKAEEFKKLREAYEVLSDTAQRARYDRRGQPRTGPFFGNMWNRGNVNVGAPPTSATRAAGNDLDLEDIFNDFSGVGDFGFTGQTRGQPSTQNRQPPRTPPRPGARPAGAHHGVREERPPRGPTPGRDIPVSVDVPPEIAARGGTVTVSYSRLRRADDGHTLYRYDELHDLRVPPHTRHGETLRVERLGDAGLDGGMFGDLVVDVRVAGKPEARGASWDPEVEGKQAEPKHEERHSGRMRMPGHEAPTTPDGALRVDISVVQALLGGRLSVVTPTGTVRVNVPPGTSSGTRMRLRGRGPAAADGTPTDLVAELRIVVPKVLDDESRALIERFAALNPTMESD
jgi:DnaJ-class molecular chaperone